MLLRSPQMENEVMTLVQWTVFVYAGDEECHFLNHQNCPFHHQLKPFLLSTLYMFLMTGPRQPVIIRPAKDIRGRTCLWLSEGQEDAWRIQNPSAGPWPVSVSRFPCSRNDAMEKLGRSGLHCQSIFPINNEEHAVSRPL